MMIQTMFKKKTSSYLTNQRMNHLKNYAINGLDNKRLIMMEVYKRRPLIVVIKKQSVLQILFCK